MALHLNDRFHPQMRRKQQAEIDAGKLRKLDALELLGQEQLRPLAILSMYMLIAGAVFFGLLNYAAYYWHTHTPGLGITGWGLLLWLVINIVSYVVILLVHEAIHGLVIAALGGKPYFGAKLPLALYCGAKNQLFHRNQYIMVALAPLVVITLAGIVLTLFAPVAASYVIFATVGNFSGAAGDVWSTERVLRMPPGVLIEDTETGYQAWEIAPDLPVSPDVALQN